MSVDGQVTQFPCMDIPDLPVQFHILCFFPVNRKIIFPDRFVKSGKIQLIIFQRQFVGSTRLPAFRIADGTGIVLSPGNGQRDLFRRIADIFNLACRKNLCIIQCIPGIGDADGKIRCHIIGTGICIHGDGLHRLRIGIRCI